MERLGFMGQREGNKGQDSEIKRSKQRYNKS